MRLEKTIAFALILAFLPTQIAFAGWRDTKSSGDTFPSADYNRIIDASWDELSGDIWRATGKVGIGTTTPTTALDVTGTINATAFSIGGTAITSTAAELNILDGVTSTTAELNFVDGVTSAIQAQIDSKTSSQWTTASSDIYFSSGNVGIGTTSPAGTLDITDSQPDIYLTDSVNGDSWRMVNVGVDNSLRFQYNSANRIYFDDNGGIGVGSSYSVATPANGMIIQGNVGIGTAAPQGKLDVRGSLCLNGGADCRTTWPTSGDLGSIDGSGTANYLPKFSDSDTLADSVIYETSGNLGIGTTTPTQKLDVNGYITTDSGYLISGNTALSRSGGILSLGASMGYTETRLRADNTDVMTIKGGNVGIGTTSPGHLLHAYKSSGDNEMKLETDGEGGTTYWSDGVRAADINPLGGFIIANAGDTVAGLQGFRDGANDAGKLQFLTQATAGANAVRMTIKSNGNVGIGTTAPTQKLDVAGNINISDGQYYMYGGQNALRLAKGTDTYYANTFVGVGAGNPSVQKQTAVGYQAGHSNTGTNQTAVGSYAGHSNTGTNQTAVGYSAGRSNTGTSQTALGNYAGYSNTGDQQTALGNYAGQSNTGTHQTALGYYAGNLNTGDYQTAVGMYAGRSNSGDYQTALGYNAGNANTGDRVTGIGSEATRDNTADDVVAIGYQAGKTNSTANQFIVKQANINATPLIQGDFSSGNVGIGTTAPGAKLEINESSTANFYPLALTSGVIGTDTNTVGMRFGYAGDTYQKGAIIFEGKDANARGKMHFALDGNANSANADLADSKVTIQYDGNVGIGTTAPVEKLDVVGNINSSSTFRIGATAVGGEYNAQLAVAASETYLDYIGKMHIRSKATLGGAVSEKVTILNNGNVGIGTTAPTLLNGSSSRFLEIDGSTNPGLAIRNTGTGGNQYLIYSNATGAGTGSFRIYDTTNNNDRMVISNTGNVGIGTTAPGEKLDVAGNIRATGDICTDGGYCLETIGAGGSDNLGNHTATQNIQLASYWLSGDGGNEGIRVDSSGNVGIGTTAPEAKLHISAGDALLSNDKAYAIEKADGTNQNIARLNTSNELLLSSGGGNIEFWGGSSQLVTIENTTGNVGIGTTVPSGDLHIYKGSGLEPMIYLTADNSLNDADDMRIVGGNSTGMKFQDYSGGSWNTNLFLEYTGKVGIGTTAPGYRFHVDDSSSSGTWGARIAGGDNALMLTTKTGATGDIFSVRPQGVSKFVIDTNGNVGIGTTAPGATLHIEGAGIDSGDSHANLIITDDTGFAQGVGGGITFRGKYNTAGTITNGGFIQTEKSNVTDGNYSFDLVLGSRTSGSAPAEAMRIDSSGNVGIGGSPSEILTVFGTSYDPEVLVSSSGAAYIEFARDGYTAKGSIGALGGYEMNLSYNMDYRTQDHKYYDSTKDAFWLTFQDAGMFLQHAPSGSSASDIWYAAGNIPIAVLKNKHTILGTAGTTVSDHGEMLQVLGSVYVAYGPLTITTTSAQPQVKLISATTGSTALYFGDTAASYRGSILYNNSGDYMAYHTAAAERMRITSSGNVGIGTTAPTSKLYVSGDIYTTGNMSALSITDRTPYPQDLATAYEAVFSMQKLPEGEYDPDNKEHQLDHSQLSEFVRSGEGRDLSATVSAQNEVIKDLVKRIEELEKQLD